MSSLGLRGAWGQPRPRRGGGGERKGAELLSAAWPPVAGVAVAGPLLTRCLLALPQRGLFGRPDGGEHIA